MAKNKILILVIVLVVLGGGLLAFKQIGKVFTGGDSDKVTPTPVLKEITNIQISERPFVKLTPKSDGKQLTQITMELSRIVESETVEYELTYTTDQGPRGVIGTINLAGAGNSVKDLLLGSCSRNVCRYDQGITDGELVLKVRGKEAVKKFMSEFKVVKGGQEVESKDGKFKLTGKLDNAFYVTAGTVGLPAEVIGEVISGPYSVFTNGKEALTNGKVLFTVEDSTATSKILFWDGTKWVEKTGAKTEGDQVSATADKVGVFVLVSSS